MVQFELRLCPDKLKLNLILKQRKVVVDMQVVLQCHHA